MAEGAIKLEIVTPEGLALHGDGRDRHRAERGRRVRRAARVTCPCSPRSRRASSATRRTVRKSKSPSGPASWRSSTTLRCSSRTTSPAKKTSIPCARDLDLKDADEALDRLEAEPGSPAYLENMRKELWAAARLTLYGDPPPPTVHTYSEVLSGTQESFEDQAVEAGEHE